MKWPRNQDWTDWGISEPLERLFYLRWLELFSSSALDTWQVRTLNARRALEEILQVIEVSEEHPVYRHNVPFVVAEAHALAMKDPIIKARYAFVVNYLEPMTKKKNDDIDLKALRAICRQALSRLATYGDDVLDEICRFLRQKDAKRKEEFLQLMLCFATELRGRGYSIDFLSDAESVLTDATKCRFEDRVRAVAARCSGTEVEYKCFIHVSFAAPEVAGGDTDVELLQGMELQQLLGDHASFVTNPTGQYARVRVRAVDAAGAVAKARDKVASLLAAHSLYEPEKTFVWRGDEALVTSRGGSEMRRFSVVPRYLRNAKNPHKRVEQLFGLMSNLPPNEGERLAAALEYHRLAISAPTDEARLVNLWIALESLVRHSDKPLIRDVCGLVPEVVALGFPYRLILNLAIQIRMTPEYDSNTTLSGAFSPQGQRRVEPGKVVEVLLLPDEDELLGSISRELSAWPLLVNRIFHLRKTVFSSQTVFASSLDRHRRDVDWQLRRIYRARNQVMHHAARPQHLGQLIQHLHTYFSLTLTGLVRSARVAHSDVSVWEALEQRRRLFEYLVELLKSDRRPKITKDALLDPERLLDTPGGDLAWSSIG